MKSSTKRPDREHTDFVIYLSTANYKKLMFAVRRASLRTGQGSGVVLQILHFVQDDKSGSFRMTENTAQDDRKHRSRGQKTPFRRTRGRIRSGGENEGWGDEKRSDF